MRRLAVILSLGLGLLNLSTAAFGQSGGLGQLTAVGLSGTWYVAGGGTAQAQTVTLAPAIATLANGMLVCWLPTAANTGAAPTLAVNGTAAKSITKLGTTALIANDITTTAVACAIYDGTEFQLQNPQTVPASSSAFPVTVSGTVNSGGIPCFTSTTNEASSAAIAVNVLIKGGGAGACVAASTLSDDGTTTSLNGTFQVTDSTGIPAKVANITTVGLGVPVVGWKSNVTAQSASQTTVTVATAPGAGDYEIHYFADLNTPCTTGSNSVLFTWNWTDATNARVLTTGSMAMGAAQSTTSYLSGIIPIHVGSGNVTYTSTVTGTCATGTSTYDINAWVARAN